LDNELAHLPNGLEDISSSLEREFILRRFNKSHLEMEINSGSPINQLIGVGERMNKDTKTKEPVYDFFPTFVNHVIRTFQLYPVAKTFGLSIDTAMALPVDQWYQIRKIAETLPPIKHVDVEAELIKLVREVIVARGGNE
jgi:hypothetical protein